MAATRLLAIPIPSCPPVLLICCEIVDSVGRADGGNAAASHPDYLVTSWPLDLL
jgi:hypothetical protein